MTPEPGPAVPDGDAPGAAIQLRAPVWHGELPSTNAYLLEQARSADPPPTGTVIAARRQTAGRGRYDRRWIAQPDRDLAVSLLLRPGVDFPRLASLPMAAALGVAAGLERAGVHASTKWPNDLLVGDRKLCGILSERAEGGPAGAVVLGIGLNVNMRADEAERIGQPATSILLETGLEHPLEEMLALLSPHLEAYLERWRVGGFAALRQEWTARCARLGQWVRIGEGPGARVGLLHGFGPDGELLLRGSSGTIQAIWSGDVGVPG